MLRLVRFRALEVIVRQGDPGDALYIIETGTVQVMKDGVVLRVIGREGFFGERALIKHESRTANVIATEETACLVLHHDDFLRVVDESITQLLLERLELQDDSVSLLQLVLVKELGKGMFGSVYMVAHRAKKTLYALKTVSRPKVKAYDLYANVRLERQVMLELDHVFIAKLVKTFKDAARVYFLMELVNGMDLFDVIRKIGTIYPGLLKECECKFYICSLLLALEHLHERSIVYRDLKPENVVVDAMGYLKLVDFGTAKVLKGRTFTTIGTPHYMAPEVILGKGYGLSVDLWSLGIIAYEFVCGGVPFGEDEDDPFKIYEKVLRQSLRWPSAIPKGSKIRDFTELLLCKNEAVRGAGVSSVKKHKWLDGFEWERLILKQLSAPYIPKAVDLTGEIEATIDASNVSVTEAVQDTDETSLPQLSQIEPDSWDKDF